MKFQGEMRISYGVFNSTFPLCRRRYARNRLDTARVPRPGCSRSCRELAPQGPETQIGDKNSDFFTHLENLKKLRKHHPRLVTIVEVDFILGSHFHTIKTN